MSAGVTGSISGEAPAGNIDGAIPASGEHDDNRLNLQASQSYLPLPYRSGIVVRNWSTIVNAAGTSMSGRFHLTIQFRTNNVYPDTWEIEAEVLSLTR